ncbi:hypothetical protein UFOVP602_18 [uncultured Caudovirales phage]|jgi:hypothetical protein|uniref:Uncharacterized protein n=1 Tax=uncultured Caudovirales phage TaxID=2100421 RepID=A0A6J5N1X9_9CAUD|nr:hypothetical protein UFOVP602_18 [uncultured Caudovirales phage]
MTKIIIPAFFCACLFGCQARTADSIQAEQQERILSEGTAQTGMPAIKNFRERKLLKDIIELRDQDGLVTYTYLVSEQTGKIGQLICKSIGYGIPAATQYTNPQKTEGNAYGITSLSQADPNGLFSPSSAEGTWVMCLDQKAGKALPVYVEPRIIVSPFEASGI